MRSSDIFELVLVLVLLSVAVWQMSFEFRDYFRRLSSRYWPATNAIIREGTVGRVSGAGRFTGSCSFLGYAYVVQGVRYVGLFAILAKEEQARELQKNLTGQSIEIRYKSSDPNLSVVGDLHDSRFGGLSATQNSVWLRQSPLFQITAAI